MRSSAILRLAFLVATAVSAAPLLDLAGGDDFARPREKPLSQEDLVYTDNIKSDEGLLRDAAQILFNVPGRQKPERTGKVVHKFRANDLVKILRESKDKRWLGVETLLGVGSKGKKLRAWVPKNSVKPPPPPDAAAAGAGAESGSLNGEASKPEEMQGMPQLPGEAPAPNP